MEKKRYVTCWVCRRDFELLENKEKGKIWGKCPICKTAYKVDVPYWKK